MQKGIFVGAYFGSRDRPIVEDSCLDAPPSLKIPAHLVRNTEEGMGFSGEIPLVSLGSLENHSIPDAEAKDGVAIVVKINHDFQLGDQSY